MDVVWGRWEGSDGGRRVRRGSRAQIRDIRSQRMERPSLNFWRALIGQIRRVMMRPQRQLWGGKGDRQWVDLVQWIGIGLDGLTRKGQRQHGG